MRMVLRIILQVVVAAIWVEPMHVVLALILVVSRVNAPELSVPLVVFNHGVEVITTTGRLPVRSEPVADVPARLLVIFVGVLLGDPRICELLCELLSDV